MKFPYYKAIVVAETILDLVHDSCTRIVIAGSIRRQASEVFDIEILYISHTTPADADLFGECAHINLADRAVAAMLHSGLIHQRLNTRGQAIWGKRNKLAIHTRSGIPIDFFATTEDCWWNYLVCRTGPAENNIRIATAAKTRGYQWNPYGPGYTRLHDGQQVPMTSEAAVFHFVSLPFVPPWDRR